MLSSISMPLLGTVHGKLPADQAIVLFKQVALEKLPDCLEKIWLILPEGCDCQCLSPLRLQQKDPQ
jgi:hypothetical protein